MKKDNSTLRLKIGLRREVLLRMEEEELAPVVMETHGGLGKVGDACYAEVPAGVVFEKDPEKAALLARKRPTWSVWESDCVRSLRNGVGAHLAVNLLDVDPYGDPWPVFDAFFDSERPRAPVLWVAVNDGLGRWIRGGHAWKSPSLKTVVAKHGNDLYGKYLEIAKELLAEKALTVGYRVTSYAAYWVFGKGDKSHYSA